MTKLVTPGIGTCVTNERRVHATHTLSQGGDDERRIEEILIQLVKQHVKYLEYVEATDIGIPETKAARLSLLADARRMDGNTAQEALQQLLAFLQRKEGDVSH